MTIDHPLDEPALGPPATGTSSLEPAPAGASAPWPVSDSARTAAVEGPAHRTDSRPTRARPGVEARQVTRVIRRIDPWSVLRVAVAFFLSLWMILVVASVIVWWVAAATGATGHVESFVAQMLADESFVLDGGQLLWAGVVGGVILVVAGTGFSVLLAVLFNVLSELTGGLRVSVIEIETARRSRL